MKLACVALAAVLAAGCGKKSSKAAPDIAGLSAVPASATAVVVADVSRVIDSPLVDRAVDQLLLRDPVLRDRWQKLYNSCKLDARKLRHVVLAIAPHDKASGTGPVLMVVTGQIVETE